jgi:hypothetical protein
MLLQKRSVGHMFADCGAQSRSRSEEKNLPEPFSKKMSQFSKKMHFLRQSFSKKIFSMIIFRKKVIPPVSYLVLLPNDLRLFLAWKGQHPENIIQRVEHAFAKHVKLLRLSANRSARSDYKFR